MDINEKIHIESIKSLTRFYESYLPYKNHKKHSHEKNISPKKSKKKFSHEIKNIEKLNLIIDNISSLKHNYKHHHKSSQLANHFYDENQIYDREHYKSQDKPIKINLVNQKFKIADDFNEKNSNKFLNEKDECLREVFLSDEIEEKESTSFVFENEKGSINDLSAIRENKNNYDLSNKQIKTKKEEEDSIRFISKLLDDLK